MEAATRNKVKGYSVQPGILMNSSTTVDSPCLHISPVLPAYFIQCMGYLPQ